MRSKKRISFIAGIHFIFSFAVFVSALVLMAGGDPQDPESIRPLIFIILQWMANFPLVMMLVSAAGWVLFFLRINFGMRLPTVIIIAAAAVIAMPLNSLLWGFFINRMFFPKKKKLIYRARS